MLTDSPLILASSEAVPHGGGSPGGIGATTAAAPIDLASTFANGLSLSDLGSTLMELVITIPTAFTTGPNISLDFRLVSLPIAPSLLTDATTSGKRTHIASVVTTDADDDFTVTGHNLPLGTPFYLSALATTGTIATNTLYYAVPTAANKFKAATSLANALAGTTSLMSGGDGTATVEFLPFVHAATGPIPASFLKAGARIVARSQPWMNAPLSKLAVPTGQTTAKPLGSVYAPGLATGGGTTAFEQLVPGRYLCLQVVPSGSIDTTGRYSAHVVVNGQVGTKCYPIGSTIS